MAHSPRHAVVLLSGGLDSTTVLAQATHEGYVINALTFRYGQRHTSEIDAARAVAERYRVARHEIIDIDLRAFGGSALTADIDVPKDRSVDSAHDIPITYVPARNTIFLSFALAFAEVTESRDLNTLPPSNRWRTWRRAPVSKGRLPCESARPSSCSPRAKLSRSAHRLTWTMG
jgi:7-cyano-7-deazaguanine synthase in queuosine biosynthesis